MGFRFLRPDASGEVVAEWTVPRRFDGKPLRLKNLASRAVRSGLFDDRPEYQAYDRMLLLVRGRDAATIQRSGIDAHRAVREITERLFQHFTGERLDEHFVLDWIPDEDALRAEEPALLSGFGVGPLCFVPRGRIARELLSAFHEIGHAMFPARGPNAREVGACYIERLFFQKLQAEILAFRHVNHEPATAEWREAGRILESGRTPAEVWEYNDFQTLHPDLAAFMQPGQRVTWRRRAS